MANFSKYPTSGNSTVTVAAVKIFDFTQQVNYNEDVYGLYLLVIKNNGARNFTDLYFRHAMDGTTMSAYAFINDSQADIIASKLTAGQEVSIIMPIPCGNIEIYASSVANDGTCVIWYERVEAVVSDVLVNGDVIPRDMAKSTAVNSTSIAVDASDAIAVVVGRGQNLIVENISGRQIYYALGQNTNAGARGLPLTQEDDDGAGGYVLGTGGYRIIAADEFVGTVYFYCPTGNGVIRYQLI